MSAFDGALRSGTSISYWIPSLYSGSTSRGSSQSSFERGLFSCPLLCSKISLSLKIKILIQTVFRPILTYGALTQSSASMYQIKRLNTLQNRMLRMIVGAPWFMSTTQIPREPWQSHVSMNMLLHWPEELSKGLLGRRTNTQEHFGELNQDKPPLSVSIRRILEDA